jgi:hypothetical protein
VGCESPGTAGLARSLTYGSLLLATTITSTSSEPTTLTTMLMNRIVGSIHG